MQSEDNKTLQLELQQQLPELSFSKKAEIELGNAGPSLKETVEDVDRLVNVSDDKVNDTLIQENDKYSELQDHCFIGVIRHAEKANLHEVNNPRWVVDKDPPLSTRGDRQATFTGQYLKEYFQKHNMKFDKIVIESSPFLRCLQTANETALALGVHEVTINYVMSDHLYPRDYPDYDPIRKLLSQTVDDLNDKEFKEFNLLSEKVTFKDGGYYKQEIFKRWPEQLSGVHERSMLTADYYSKRMQQFKENGDLDNGRKVCLLLFTHGMVLLQMGNLIDKMTEAQTNQDSSVALPDPTNIEAISEDQKSALVDRIRDIDWVFAKDKFDKNGNLNKYWIDYCAMNAFAVKVNKENGQFEDYRILENKLNEPYHAFCKIDAPDKD